MNEYHCFELKKNINASTSNIKINQVMIKYKHLLIIAQLFNMKYQTRPILWFLFIHVETTTQVAFILQKR
jgi:hypothetical protein